MTTASKEAQMKKQTKILDQMLREEDNRFCAECGAKGPRWVSVNLGVFLCIRCSGIHRNIGVHVTLVKSVNLDLWKPEQLEAFQEMGNLKGKEKYEYYIPADYPRPTEHSDNYTLEQFIRAKYERKQWIKREGDPQKYQSANTSNGSVTPALSTPSATPSATPRDRGAFTPSATPRDSRPPSATPKQKEVNLLGGDDDQFDNFQVAKTADPAKVPQYMSNFGSAPTPVATPMATPAAQAAPKAAEPSFFDMQPDQSQAKAQVSRDAILSLYNQPTQPAYGNPAYGRPGYPAQPGYGHPQPQHGYGHAQPAFGAPQYGQPQPGFGQPQPMYGQPQPAFGQPQPAYGAPMAYGGYGQPQPNGFMQPARPGYPQQPAQTQFGRF